MAEDLTRPYVGYRSAGRRPERAQDRTAAANAPLAALRGMVSGVLGAPGDVESLVRMLPGLSEQTVLPTSEDVERRLPLRSVSETPVGRVATGAGQLGGGFYTGPGSPLRAVAALPSAVRRAARDFAVAAGQPAVNVVKPKGGNWLAGSVEKAIEPMKRDATGRAMEEASLYGYKPEVNPETEAINKWLDKKLRTYIRNEMATPEDPIRALAESWPARQQELLAAKQVQIDKAVADMEKARAARGFTPEMMTSSQARIRELEKERELIAAREALHIAPEQVGVNRYKAPEARRASGYPVEGLGQSEAAKAWEAASDVAIYPSQARHLAMTKEVEANPFLLKVPPETMVYEVGPRQSQFDGLGFTHLADELRNALNPASGLPENLLLKYADLEKKTVPDIVNQVADINAWRAVQKAEVDKARSSNVATQIFKEYPESPQGLRWVELRLPKETGKKTTVERSELDELGIGVDDATLREVAEDMAFDEGLEEGTQAFNDFVDATIRFHNTKKPVEVDESVKALEDALKYEGEVLKHCVGGYCDDVVQGRSRIYSLRDKTGQPHVTIEVKPGRKLTEKDLPNDVRDMLAEQYGDESREAFEAAVQRYMQERSVPDEIIQIKGKANKAPKEEYLPFVQDFVRSQKWGRVGDLENTGLYKADPGELGMFVPSDPRLKNLPGRRTENFQRAKEAGLFGDQEYLTRAEWEDILRKQVESESGPLPPLPEPGFAAGGLVGLHQRYATGGAVVQPPQIAVVPYDEAKIDALASALTA